jgi:hypothetical protein
LATIALLLLSPFDFLFNENTMALLCKNEHTMLSASKSSNTLSIKRKHNFAAAGSKPGTDTALQSKKGEEKDDKE